jgi:hypothetical protein
VTVFNHRIEIEADLLVAFKYIIVKHRFKIMYGSAKETCLLNNQGLYFENQLSSLS